MIAMIWFLATFTYTYTKSEALVRAAKIPPILPLVPYLPQLFKVDFLPPFYFTYWIVIIAIVAITHEFAHGIIARLNNIKIKSTGFGFLGPFLAAFVEPDEKQMQKTSKFAQLSVLAAGTFANVLMTILFGIILILFFQASFSPSGVYFNTYATNTIELSSITAVNGLMISEYSKAANYKSDELVKISSGNSSYFLPGGLLENYFKVNAKTIVVYENAPAIRARLGGAIEYIGGVPITSPEILRLELGKYRPGDNITITTVQDDGSVDTEITLANHDGKAYLGIGFINPERKGFSGIIYRLIIKIKDPSTYYTPNFDGDFAWFIYNLLWWMVMINFSVALVNMLPVGIFDGGRFFYLTVWGITNKEKWAKKAFSASTWLILAVFVWLMIRWVIAFI
jgi:membrane-associated protease RseP (regulator of RpoE activity)